MWRARTQMASVLFFSLCHAAPEKYATCSRVGPDSFVSTRGPWEILCWKTADPAVSMAFTFGATLKPPTAPSRVQDSIPHRRVKKRGGNHISSKSLQFPAHIPKGFVHRSSHRTRFSSLNGQQGRGRPTTPAKACQLNTNGGASDQAAYLLISVPLPP